MEVAAVRGVGAALDQPGRDDTVDQPAGVGAALAHQELAEPVQAQGAVLLEQAQHLGLRRGDAVGFEGLGQQPVAFALGCQDREPQVLSLTHGRPIGRSERRRGSP